MLWNMRPSNRSGVCTIWPAGPQIVGEGAHTGGQPLGVVEEQDLGHGGPPGSDGWTIVRRLAHRLR